MRTDCSFVICLAMILVTGCKPEPEPNSSLVGATELPAFADLEKETIVLARSHENDGNDLLSIELNPTGDLLVSHYRREGRPLPPDFEDRLIADERLRISPLQLQRLRNKLWRLRPDDGAGVNQSIPVGCHWVYDGGEDWQLFFFRKERPEDAVIASLPYPRQCSSRAYVEARQLLAEVTRNLPASEILARFLPGRL